MDKTKNRLGIEEDEKLQRLVWTYERISWVLMFLFITVTVLGFLGRGGLIYDKEKAVATDQRFDTEYEPYIREGTSTKLTITFLNKAATPQLRLNKELVERTQIEHIIPEPSGSVADATGITYTFDALEKGAKVALYFKPEKLGDLQAILAVDSSTLTLNQFVYP